MFDHLQIDDRRERWLVGCADLLLKPVGDIGRWRRPAATAPPRRVLLFRLERIGDLLMTLDALGEVRRRLPDAVLQLVVGTWNAALARLIPAVDHVETLDVPWLSREATPSTLAAVVDRTARWRRQAFDLTINFEPDIRTNALAAASGAPRRSGWAAKGGAAFLTDALPYDPSLHVAANALRLVDRTLPTAVEGEHGAGVRTAANGSVPPGGAAVGGLRIPAAARTRAERRFAARDGRGPLIGLNPGAGRAVKEWPAERFAAAAARLAAMTQATVVLLGSAAEQRQAAAVARALPAGVPRMDLLGAPLVDLAAILERLTLLIVGDTGPMHLAAAVGTPVVAIFGPSDPARYAPRSARTTVVHADLWCRPCNRMRHPPARCRGATPDCLEGVTTDAVVAAARRLLDGGGVIASCRERPHPRGHDACGGGDPPRAVTSR